MPDLKNMEVTEPEKVDLTSGNIIAEQCKKLAQLFPEVVTEGGKIDFDKLRLALGDTLDVGRERYGMLWPGKAECFKTIQMPSVATLIPDKDRSKDFDTTQNLLIVGDNLEVLKLMQKAYLSKVKMIYIDPPYNTGGDFIYPDDYSETLDTYLRYTEQVDAGGRKFSTNTETDGRFHSKWLSMMYPRLFLARNLLKDEGLIFISIDDGEVDNLKKLCSEIFGEENFIAQLVWEKARKNDAKFFSVGHEYMLVYARSQQTLRNNGTLWREEKPGAKEIWETYIVLRKKHGNNDRSIEKDLQAWFKSLPEKHPSKRLARYKRVDKYGPWRDADISWPGSGGPRYEVLHPVTKQPCRIPEAGWRFATKETMDAQIAAGAVEFREDHTEPPMKKAHIRPTLAEISDVEEEYDEEEQEDPDTATHVRGSYFYKQSQVAIKYLRSLMGAKVFDNPKDHEELLKLIRYATADDDEALILDFFAGSGATGEAVLRLNEMDHTNKRFILVQLPEPNNPKKKTGKAALAAGLATVADITQERMKRVIAALKKAETDSRQQLKVDLSNGAAAPQPVLDRGFRLFKLYPSNFKTWDATKPDSAEAISKQLELHIDHILPGRTQEDILFELLLKSGFPLSTTLGTIELAEKKVFSIEDGTMFICLEPSLTIDAIREMAQRKPERVICLDAAFRNNDQLKSNAVQTMKSRGISNFRTI